MKRQLNAQHEKLLVAMLAGMVILAAAAFAVTPAGAADSTGQKTEVVFTALAR